MSKNITLLGANYPDVPAVELPQTGGGIATFTDVTDTTATASDVAQGKYFYGADGVKTEGTASGDVWKPDHWTRPADWPVLSNLDRSDEVVYITCDARYEGFIDTNVRISSSKKYTLEIGHIEGSTFVPEISYLCDQYTYVFHIIPTDPSGYKVCRIKAEEGYTITGFNVGYAYENARKVDDTLFKGEWNAVLEVYGNLPNAIYNVGGRACRQLQSFDITNPKPSGNISYSFAYCSSLENLDVSTWDFSGVTNLDSFVRYTNIKWMNGYKTMDTSNVTNMASLFGSVPMETIDLSQWNTSNVTILENIFLGCPYLRDMNLGSIDLSNVVNTQGAFRDLNYIRKITLPSSITTIGDNAFAGSLACMEFHFKSTVPPTLANTNAFPAMSTDGVNRTIYVPYSEDHSILEAYQTATNWNTFASYMQEEPH